MASNTHQLHFIFFPQPGDGHLIPTVDMARLFSRHGVKTTIVTTPQIALLFANTIQRDQALGFDINSRVIELPASKVGLPEGCEHVNSIKSKEMCSKFLQAFELLQRPIQDLLEELRPDCLVADLMFPWATDIAAKFGIPRLVFGGTGCIAHCIRNSLKLHEPFKNIISESEPFDVPGLPDRIEMTKLQIPNYVKDTGDVSERRKVMNEADKAFMTSYGIIINSFHGLEPGYADYYSKVMGRKAWHIGPVSLCCKNRENRAERGNAASIDCLKWLDSKKPNSVLYVSFGSMVKPSSAQLMEIAKALEESEQSFIWVVKLTEEDDREQEEWFLQGFEERNKEKGLIIRGWAPQILILDHESVGGFMTHCGWNSTIESVSSGVPMVTWPFFTEQFCNEMLITDILKIGVKVGAKEAFTWTYEGFNPRFMVTKEEIEIAVRRVMVGEEAEEMRNRGQELKNMAKIAVEEGGSSYCDLNALLDELRLMNSHEALV